MSLVDIRPTDPGLDTVKELFNQADAYFAGLYPPQHNHLIYADELSQENVLFLGAYDGNVLVACGAVKILQDDDGSYGEIKRMYVVPDARGRGLGLAILQQLEAHLLRQGIQAARLETGMKQAEALALYHKAGYRKRGAFGEYLEDNVSIFLEKALTN